MAARVVPRGLICRTRGTFTGACLRGGTPEVEVAGPDASLGLGGRRVEGGAEEGTRGRRVRGDHHRPPRRHLAPPGQPHAARLPARAARHALHPHPCRSTKTSRVRLPPCTRCRLALAFQCHGVKLRHRGALSHAVGWCGRPGCCSRL